MSVPSSIDLPSTRVRRTLALRGPNLWALATVLESWVEFPPLENPRADWWQSVLGWVPALATESFTPPGTDKESIAAALQQITLQLQSRTDLRLSFCRTVPTSEPELLRIVIQYDEEDIGRHAFEIARRMVDAALMGQEYEAADALEKLRDHADDICLGPSTRSMVNAALVRGIPVRRLTEGSLVQLGWGRKQRKILAAATSQTSAIAEDIVQDKDLTRIVLQSVGLPVPRGRPVKNADDAWVAAQEIGVPVVVKPRDGNQGRGVVLNLSTREQVMAAYVHAFQASDSIIVEKYAEGEDYRLLVIGKELIAASRRMPAHVIGDGVHTIKELVDIVNQDPQRASDHAAALSKIRIDNIALTVLAEQGMSPDSVPEEKRLVLIRRNANLSTGGTAVDVTDQVHPTIRTAAVEAAQMVGLDICGIDLMAIDISQPLSERNGVLIELNARPGLRMHLYPTGGKPRAVGQAVIDTMFPPGDNGRIPVVAVTGTNGKTTTARFIAHLLAQPGWTVGLTSTDGVIIGGRVLDHDDCSGPQSARSVLAYPTADAAVLETARGGILRAGLAFDHCDVAVVTNIGQGDHLGLNEVFTAEQLAEVKQCIVAAVPVSGTAVLNAADPLTVKMAHTFQRRTIFFALDGGNEVIREHRAAGGSAIFARDGVIIRAEGDKESEFMPLDQVPLTRGGRISFQVENTLASVAAAWALSIDDNLIRQGARTFVPDFQQNAGRFNVIEHQGITVIVDYGHNVDALKALLASLEQFPAKRRLVLYTSAGDRRDADIIEQGRMLAPCFDEAWLYEGDYVRGRAPGEIMSLLAQGLEGASRVKRVESIQGHFKAIDLALASAQPGDLLMIQADTAADTVAYVQGLQKSAGR